MAMRIRDVFDVYFEDMECGLQLSFDDKSEIVESECECESKA